MRKITLGKQTCTVLFRTNPCTLSLFSMCIILYPWKMNKIYRRRSRNHILHNLIKIVEEPTLLLKYYQNINMENEFLKVEGTVCHLVTSNEYLKWWHIEFNLSLKWKKKKFKYQKFLSDYESYPIFLMPVFNQISSSLPKSYLLPLKLTGNKLINVKCLEQNSACSKNSINVSNKISFCYYYS